MMLVTAVIALGLCGLKEGTQLWASLLYTLMLVMLLGAILSAVFSRAAQRAGWLGFILFAWSYYLWIYAPWPEQDKRPPKLLWAYSLDGLHKVIHREPEYIPNPRYQGPTFLTGTLSFGGEPPTILKPGIVPWQGDLTSYQHVGHSLGVLLFGGLGAFWARLAWHRREHTEPPPASPAAPLNSETS
jgi:hypothetical protein